MRSDYGLYIVAVICFVIAGAFAAANIPSYTLTEASGISVVMIFIVIGIISAAVGYSARPKAMMPPTQPSPALAAPTEHALTPSATIQEEMPPPAPIPPPTEEAALEPAPPQEPQPTPAQPIAPPPESEQPAIVPEEEKPKEKAVRRRRRKASA